MHPYDKNRITYFAETDRRNKRIPFGIKAEDRTRHMYIIGKTGMGKSTLIENMAVQDIKNGEGFAFVDPHGKSAALLLDYIPPERIKDVVYFAPFDMDNPISFNIMEDIGADKRHLVANGLMSVFKKIWLDAWSARMEYILSNTLLALLEYPDATLLGVNRMLTDKIYRKKVVDNIKDPSVRTFWVEEFAKYSEKYTQEATPAIQNKIGQFTSNPLIRNIIGQPHSSFDLRKMMDEGKILIVNLSKGQVGEGNANLLGSMIITKIYLAAMSRADLVEGDLKKIPYFHLYVDEFQSFANESFANILSEARKYKLSLIMAHQYIEQMSEEVTAAVFGNVGTQIMFRVGATDAEQLEKEYEPVFTAEDMVNLGFTQIYLKLMIDGVASHPFSAVTLGPIAPQINSLRKDVIESSRTLYGGPRIEVEKKIVDWYEAGNTFLPRAPREQSVHQNDYIPKVASSYEKTSPRSDTPSGVSFTKPASFVYPVATQPIKQYDNKQIVNKPGIISVPYVNPQPTPLRPPLTTAPRGMQGSIEKAIYPPSASRATEGQSKLQSSEKLQTNFNESHTLKQQPVRQEEQSQDKKFGRSFAEAMKDLAQESRNKDRNPALVAVPQSVTNNYLLANTLKDPHTENISELKAALSKVLIKNDGEISVSVFDSSPPPINAQSSITSVLGPKIEQNNSEPIEESKIKEVPEDVLTAILRGED